MKYFFVLLLLINPFYYVRNINLLQEEAQIAFYKKDYFMSILKYNHLINSYQIEDEHILLNLAHAYFHTNKQDQSTYYYLQAIKKGVPDTKSIALNQLACIEYENNNLEEALSLFKEAILNNPFNSKARYNYELLKKKLKNLSPQKKELSPQPQNNLGNNTSQNLTKVLNQQKLKEKQNKESNSPDATQQNTEEQALSGNKKDVIGNNKSLQPRKLEEIKLNKEKAEAILEALKNQEIQYIQQLKRTEKNTSSKKGNRSGW
ncbi:MAG: tetratricopeptide repeat protein [Microscillaceae bacterium]|nr:tetratricopeptide repeat protein [Microscillaceae bacterium]